MKKVIIFLVIVIAIVTSIFYLTINYKANYNLAKMENKKYEDYLEKEITGNELATIINQAMNDNQKNQVPKKENDLYEENNTNSINIEIKMLDNEKNYQMETFYQGKMENFIQYYGTIHFKCMKLEYHVNTQKVKYMFFEQITQ